MLLHHRLLHKNLVVMYMSAPSLLTISAARTQTGLPIDAMVLTITFDPADNIESLGVDVQYPDELFPGLPSPQISYQLPPGQTSPFVATIRNVVPTPGSRVAFYVTATNAFGKNENVTDFLQPTATIPTLAPSNFVAFNFYDSGPEDTMNFSWNLPTGVIYDSLYVSDNNAMSVSLNQQGGKTEASYTASSNGLPLSKIITYVLNAVTTGGIVALPQTAYSYYNSPPPPDSVTVYQIDPTNNPTLFQVEWSNPYRMELTPAPPTGYRITIGTKYPIFLGLLDKLQYQFYDEDAVSGSQLNVGVSVISRSGTSEPFVGTINVQ